MQSEERLVTIRNTSDAPVTDYWDSVAYTFPAGESVTLRYGVGLHFKEQHPELEMIGESQGVAPEVVVESLTVVSAEGAAFDVTWDGHPYHFEPGATATFEASLAEAVMQQARAKGKR